MPPLQQVMATSANLLSVYPRDSWSIFVNNNTGDYDNDNDNNDNDYDINNNNNNNNNK